MTLRINYETQISPSVFLLYGGQLDVFNIHIIIHIQTPVVIHSLFNWKNVFWTYWRFLPNIYSSKYNYISKQNLIILKQHIWTVDVEFPFKKQITKVHVRCIWFERVNVRSHLYWGPVYWGYTGWWSQKEKRGASTEIGLYNYH